MNERGVVMDPLSAVLDTLLPGDGATWPSAAALGLASRTRALFETSPEADAVERLLAGLPADFVNAPVAGRESELAAAETHQPAAFEALLIAAYNAYYTDTRVRDVIAEVTGYPNRPPQPEGYDLPPFDDSLLDPVRARAPFWRDITS